MLVAEVTMKQALRAGIGALVLATHASAGDLAYRWRPESSVRFDAQMRDTVSFSGRGMNVRAAYDTHTTFNLQIAKVKNDGTALGTLVVEAFDVKAADGHRVAGLEAIPKRALKTNVEIDRKGAFRFKEIVYLVVDGDNPAQLVTMRAEVARAGLVAIVEQGEQEVTVYASFDPTTGRLSGGASEKALTPKKTTLAVDQDAQKIELLPQQMLELFRLPDGAASTSTVRQPGMVQTVVTVRVDDLGSERAHLTAVVSTAPAPDSGGDVLDASGGAMSDVGLGATLEPASGPAMAGLPASPNGPGAGSGTVSIGRKWSGTITGDFQVAEGMITRIDARLKSEMALGALWNVTTASTIALERVGR